MKLRDIVSEDEIEKLEEDECETCYTYDKLQYRTKAIRERMDFDSTLHYCPNCKEELQIVKSTTGIMGGNFYNSEHEVLLGRIYLCPECGEYFTDAVRPIHYNANHDIYYSCQRYLPKKEYQELKEQIEKSIEEDLEEYNKRKNEVSNYNLCQWIASDLDAILAGFLYKKGIL